MTKEMGAGVVLICLGALLTALCQRLTLWALNRGTPARLVQRTLGALGFVGLWTVMLGILTLTGRGSVKPSDLTLSALACAGAYLLLLRSGRRRRHSAATRQD